MTLRTLKLFGFAFSFAMIPCAASAADSRNESKIILDYSLRQVLFFGVYAPENGAKRGGLEAEIVARRNGIAYLNSKLKGSCMKSGAVVNESGTVTPTWQASVKSQGSEIFSNGVLKISLVAPMREVFKDVVKKPATLKTKEGTPISLKLPRLNLGDMNCGMLNVSVGGKTLAINPLSGSSEAGAKLVKLEFSSGLLTPATSADANLLENSNLFAALDAEPASTSENSASNVPSQSSSN